MQTMEVKLSREQLEIAHELIGNAWKGVQMQTLGGYAGTGKSTIIRYIKERLWNFEVCAFTGKAVNVLHRKRIPSAKTIHSLIYIPQEPERPAGGALWTDEERDAYLQEYERQRREARRPKDQVQFLLKDRLNYADWEDRDINDKPRMVNVNGVILDEGSMVPPDIHDDLMSFGVPIIYVGDHGQLPPVLKDGAEPFNIMANPQYRLETIHRNAGEIARFAEILRKGGSAMDYEPQECDKGTRVILKDYPTLNEYAECGQVICAFNKTRCRMNARMRSHFRRHGLPHVGEKMICLKTNRRLDLFNGLQVEVTGYRQSGDMHYLSFERNYGSATTLCEVLIDPDALLKEKPDIDYRSLKTPFDFAYAITCHKSQGDSWESVAVIEEKCKMWEHSRWAYTAATRAERELLWVPAKA